MIKQTNIWTVRAVMLVVISVVLLSLSVVISSASEVGQMQLRKNIQVTGSTVTLGDVFIGAGDAADVFVTPAPDPGRFITLPLLEVLSIVRQYDLNWDRPAGVSRIRVERKSQLLNPEDIKLIIEDAIHRDGGPNKFFLSLYGNFQNIHMTQGATTADISVNMISLDARTGRFRTSINLPTGGGGYRTVNITGRVEELIGIPVLANNASKDDVISNSDIVWLDMPKNRVSQNILLTDDLLVGMAARRTLRAGTPLRLTDIQEPVLIRKGALVAMVIEAGTMKLTTIGRALEDGGKNDIIKIMNIDSHKTIEGRVVGVDNIQILYHGNITGAGQ
ncbi:MAG: flagellar basal body P-ring formation protein FlgA [Sphingomonadales bacterium]|nr:flagellar basal body P-ring formation protein FlgA [Sphingomonadales bacterium]